jgi:hypothetical protein
MHAPRDRQAAVAVDAALLAGTGLIEGLLSRILHGRAERAAAARGAARGVVCLLRLRTLTPSVLEHGGIGGRLAVDMLLLLGSFPSATVTAVKVANFMAFAVYKARLQVGRDLVQCLAGPAVHEVVLEADDHLGRCCAACSTKRGG